MKNITKLVVHHSASSSATTTKGDIKRWHTQRGFASIGYHKVIERDGRIVDGRAEHIAGAHALGVNETSLGVCLTGDFTKEVPSMAQIDSLVRVLVQWCLANNLDQTAIFGHGEVPGGATVTKCPGMNLAVRLPSVKFRVGQEIKGLRAS